MEKDTLKFEEEHDQVDSVVEEDIEAHDRPGLRIDDNSEHVDLDERGHIQTHDHQDVWT
ncbi:hypothetical protein [Paenibacillus xerothermodurans]|uniref:hypothetical protein n=1 Tax=Paenibacillus xerothermodurans TaxID=1977292 RepID=UPI001403BE82|nr:hypothetical protein [Paenibacillus xerothermodurans]